MLNKYITYTYKEFLLDDDFIKSQLLPSDEQNEFWKILISEYPHLKEEFEKATFLVKKKIKSSQETSFSQEEQLELYLDLKKNIEQIRLRKSSFRRRYIYSCVSAIAAAVIAFFIFKVNDFAEGGNKETFFAEELNVDFNKENITLTSGDSIIELENNVNIEHHNDVISISNALTNKQAKLDVTEKNIVIVPYGKRSTLQLSDGTKIWINSATTVQYPSLFAEDKREIFVDGEIFIDVAKDASKPFIVHSKSHRLKVLGTKFVFCSYSPSYEGYVVLVEGSVDVEGHVIKPNEMIRLTSAENDFRVENVNTDLYTAWTNGWLQLESENIPTLCKRLSRYYGVTITSDESLNKEKMTGKLILTDDLNKVLSTISQNIGTKYEKNTNNEIKILSKE